MYQKMIFAVLVFTFSSHIRSAQVLPHPAVTTQNWTRDPVTGLLQPLLFCAAPAPVRDYEPVGNWPLAELTLRLSDIRPGTPLPRVVGRIKILGGVEDGGLQTIPATRFYFNPGIIVKIPVKDGLVTDPLSFSPGLLSID